MHCYGLAIQWDKNSEEICLGDHYIIPLTQIAYPSTACLTSASCFYDYYEKCSYFVTVHVK